MRARGIDSLLDLGSGGGFPGIPIAAVLPARRALLVESIAKKAAFLDAALEAVGLAGRVDVAAERAEALGRDPRHRQAWPAVTARAVARLSELAELGLPLVSVGGCLVAWKRRPLGPELSDAADALQELGGGDPEVVDCPVPGLEDHVLVVIPKIRATPAAYPRHPAVRARGRR
jgi:16S rRNA (guanine527-N7)-methyltransferase